MPATADVDYGVVIDTPSIEMAATCIQIESSHKTESDEVVSSLVEIESMGSKVSIGPSAISDLLSVLAPELLSANCKVWLGARTVLSSLSISIELQLLPSPSFDLLI